MRVEHRIYERGNSIPAENNTEWKLYYQSAVRNDKCKHKRTDDHG